MRFQKLFLFSIAYAVTLATMFALLCTISIFNCQIGQNLKVSEVLLPVIFISGVLLVVGLCVVYANLFLQRILVRKKFRNMTAVSIVLGALIGLLPSILWDIGIGAASAVFALRVDHVPFIVAGVLVAYLCVRESRPSIATTP